MHDIVLKVPLYPINRPSQPCQAHSHVIRIESQ